MVYSRRGLPLTPLFGTIPLTGKLITYSEFLQALVALRPLQHLRLLHFTFQRLHEQAAKVSDAVFVQIPRSDRSSQGLKWQSQPPRAEGL